MHLITKRVTAYPAYAYQKPGEESTWRFRLRVWVSKPWPDVPERLLRLLVPDAGEDELLLLQKRAADFLANDDEDSRVTFTFDHDPSGREYRFDRETDDNGLVIQDFEIADEDARRIFDAQPEPAKWLRLTVRAAGRYGRLNDGFGSGKVRFLEPEGLSVVSDIDDTIKVSEIPAGDLVVLRNTFLLEYKHVEDMVERYRVYGEDVSFHYVSGSPWQLYGLLQTFLVEQSQFPQGTFHMKELRKSPEAWEVFIGDLRNFVAGASYTMRQKIGQIGELMDNLPGRDFVLIGDSGECDPETFARIRDKYGARVKEIFIRVVTDEPEGSDRFAGMTRIEVTPTIARKKPAPVCREEP